MNMFCYQCEQTARGVGCTTVGVCGKDATTAALQDVLVHMVKGISMYAHRAAQLGKRDPGIDRFVLEALFATVTNVNFDAERIEQMIHQAVQVRDKARQLYEAACAEAGQQPEQLQGPAVWQPDSNREKLLEQAQELSIAKRQATLGEDVVGLQELILYAVKGAAAYCDHALILGKEDPQVFALMHALLNFLCKENPSLDELFDWAMKSGQLGLSAIELLDAANTGAYGHPEPTEVRITPVKGKAILVSGHDLKDLEELLKQTEGKGVNVYTHGEMLPCHAYPGLKKYKHLVGHYGGAWFRQRSEFERFPGAILMTTNCLQPPRDSYKHRLFTSGVVGWPGVRHISNRDFSPVIEAALAEPGFPEDEPEKKILIGFARNAVLSVADKVIEAVKAGVVRHFFLIGGCDGQEHGRSYYTEFAHKVPKDCVILTLGCGKYRFNYDDFGTVDGLPRLLDVGQCNDSYSAIKIASALAEAFNCTVNDLPLSLVLSWFEQKAVTVLMALLYLGVKNIRLGPSLPAFITPSVLQVLKEKFNIMPISTPDEDLKAILQTA